MSTRPWLVAAALLVTMVSSVTLAAAENMTVLATPGGPGGAPIVVPLRSLAWVASDRHANFRAMGLTDEEAVRAALFAKTLKRDRGAAIEVALVAEEDAMGAVFCHHADLPVPYGALGILTAPQAHGRRVVEPADLGALDVQDGVTDGAARDMYVALDLVPSDRREAGATAMGVSAVLLGREDDVRARRFPWGFGRSWSPDGLRDTFAADGLDDQLVLYMATLHVVAEVANAETGICNQ